MLANLGADLGLDDGDADYRLVNLNADWKTGLDEIGG